MSKKDLVEVNDKLDLTIKDLENLIGEKRELVESYEEDLKDLSLGAIVEIKDGLTRVVLRSEEKYKINQNDYIIKGEGFTIVDKDKRDIKPYVRYLANNKKERFRHNMIMYIAVGLGFALFMIFGMKGDIKNIKNMVEEGQGNINIIDKTGSGGTLDNIMEGFIPNNAKDTIETKIVDEESQYLGKGGGR